MTTCRVCGKKLNFWNREGELCASCASAVVDTKREADEEALEEALLEKSEMFSVGAEVEALGGDSDGDRKNLCASIENLLKIQRLLSLIAWILVFSSLCGVLGALHWAGTVAASAERYSFAARDAYWATVGYGSLIVCGLGAVASILVSLIAKYKP
ncbi:hypothetical protein [Rhodovulum marinum]|uniref:hypothetical protein n=1 Tax=Rhodovulum marinum TaxID=320662 RepID=UPI001047AA41|nr:hypothetical protein [Rhodovulum marinum]